MEPTPVQRAVIPRLMSGENLVMAASTGSGKTLAYLIPAIQSLLAQEQLGYIRLKQRPRLQILLISTILFDFASKTSIQMSRSSSNPRTCSSSTSFSFFCVLSYLYRVFIQVLSCIKSLSHYAKVSSCAVLGGEEYILQKKSVRCKNFFF